ncbi:hypothetical protein RRG08_039485 [Elysia crispata]|uniref:Uncharacterized protein n=1 Tax=Elysia crispata TaxID=231223 RepID=A0AAE1D027_9GAST|nr:hypothetical protein RRG08_039485 [Elysia crispata]
MSISKLVASCEIIKQTTQYRLSADTWVSSSRKLVSLRWKDPAPLPYYGVRCGSCELHQCGDQGGRDEQPQPQTLHGVLGITSWGGKETWLDE